VGAVRRLRITWDEGWGMKGRAVKRGLARRGEEIVARFGVDEKAIAKRHRYLTIVADLDRSRVVYLADDRKQASLERRVRATVARPRGASGRGQRRCRGGS